MAAGAGQPGTALRRCIRLAADEFAREIWSQRPLLTSRAELGSQSGFDDLFSLDAVDELLSQRGLRTPFIRLAKDGTVTPPSRYTRSGGTGAQIADQVADDRIMELFTDGHTIVFQGLHRMWPPLIDFAAALTTDLGHPVQVNAYVTPPSSQGFAAHYDVHDVFMLQVAGEKRWRIHEPVRPAPPRDDPWTDHKAAVAERAAAEPVIDTVLAPGDALYLPRGFLHAAEALGGVSCHLTVGVRPVTRQHILDALVSDAVSDPALRASLPIGVDLSDPAAIEPDVTATVAALIERLRAVTSADVAARLGPSVVASTRSAPIRPLEHAAALAALSEQSRLHVRPHLRHTLTTDGDQVVLRLPDRTLRLPGKTAKAVRSLLDGESMLVKDLPGLERDDAMTLARQLARAAVVVVENA